MRQALKWGNLEPPFYRAHPKQVTEGVEVRLVVARFCGLLMMLLGRCLHTESTALQYEVAMLPYFDLKIPSRTVAEPSLRRLQETVSPDGFESRDVFRTLRWEHLGIYS